jgi:hypothetical protein
MSLEWYESTDRVSFCAIYAMSHHIHNYSLSPLTGRIAGLLFNIKIHSVVKANSQQVHVHSLSCKQRFGRAQFAPRRVVLHFVSGETRMHVVFGTHTACMNV